MKELSIEEKAKRYDEAIKEAKECHTDGLSLHQPVKDVLEHIFPELKESEDERIKKGIIKFLIDVNNGAYTKSELEIASWIAWLEKQGTPQVRTGLELVNTIDDACDKRYSEEYAHGEYCHEQSFKWGFQEGVDWLEKQGKNNISISEATKQELEDNLHKALEKETAESWNEFLDEQGEQKPAWSEEDEEILNLIIARLHSHPNVDAEEYGKDYHWFNYLKDRVQPQSKQGCCECDEIDIQTAIEICKNAGYDLIANRLKSLRPQNTWKPSDEQIGVIEAVMNNRSFQRRHLDSLYADLKKLKS